MRFLWIVLRVNMKSIGKNTLLYFMKKRHYKYCLFICLLINILMTILVFVRYKEYSREFSQSIHRCSTNLSESLQQQQQPTNKKHINHIFFASQLQELRENMREPDRKLLNILRKHCGFPDSVSLLFIVPSGWSRKDREKRQAIRATWGNTEILRQKYGAALIFFLGYNPKIDCLRTCLTLEIQEEALINTDLVVLALPLSDRYANLSIKVLSMLSWIKRHCRLLLNRSSMQHTGIKYVVKSDLDSFWNVDKLVSLLNTLPDLRTNRVIVGNVQHKAAVQRNTMSKFKTSYSEYKESHFPDYVTGGAGYIITANSLEPLLNAAEGRPVFWLEDVYITGLLASIAGVDHIATESIYYMKPIPLTRKRYKNVIAAHSITSEEMHLLIEKQN